MKAFFEQDIKIARTPIPLLPQCGECGLYKHCLSPKMPVSGKGNKKILIVGEAPGKNEDVSGKAFVGKSGEFLEETLGRLGIELRQDCWITNAAICRPKNNELPKKAVDHCRPNIIRTIRELNPEKILLLGANAIKSVIGWLWKEDPGSISRWVGWRIPYQRLNCWIVPTWHPAHLLRLEKKQEYSLMRDLFTRHIKSLIKQKERPYQEIPNYKQEIELIYDGNKIASEIEKISDQSRYATFDFETDRLKADSRSAKILSCAISNGTKTFAFPWHDDKVMLAFREFVVSDVPKVNANIKFEERWVKRVFGCRVKNWVWDSMLAAHLKDNRPGITGLKFQAFARLGADSYDDELKPYMQATSGNGKNRLSEVYIEKLLIYNAMDALLTWKLVKLQMEELDYDGVDLG